MVTGRSGWSRRRSRRKAQPTSRRLPITYFLYDSLGSGPSLKFGGADFVDGSIWHLGADRCGEDGDGL